MDDTCVHKALFMYGSLHGNKMQEFENVFHALALNSSISIMEFVVVYTEDIIRIINNSL